MELQNIDTQIEEGILTITVNRPKALNALNKQVFDELEHVVNNIPDSVRGIIIAGAGEKAFVAGADITEFPKLNGELGSELSRRGQKIFQQIEDLPIPVVAVVNGFALGGGCELAMACHLRIAEEHARFGQPEVNLGLIPGYGGTQRLVRLIGYSKALEFLLTGDMIDAPNAESLGLANYVVPSGEGITKAKSILKKATQKAPLAIGKIIEILNSSRSIDGFELEARHFGELFDTEDMKEGVEAFLEKRRPSFEGK